MTDVRRDGKERVESRIAPRLRISGDGKMEQPSLLSLENLCLCWAIFLMNSSLVFTSETVAVINLNVHLEMFVFSLLVFLVSHHVTC